MRWHLGSDVDGFRWFLIDSPEDLSGWSAVWVDADEKTQTEPLVLGASPSLTDQLQAGSVSRWMVPCDQRNPLPDHLASADGNRIPVREVRSELDASSPFLPIDGDGS